MAIEIPTSERYHLNYDGVTKAGDAGPCCVCGKGVKEATATYVRVDFETDEAVTVEEAEERYDVAPQPIGSDCLRRHPELRPYVIKQGGVRAMAKRRWYVSVDVEAEDVHEAVEEVVAELGLNLQCAGLGLDWDGLQECENVSRSTVVQALYATMVGRFQYALAAEQGNGDNPDEFHAEADGVRYALMAFVPFEAALGLKHAAYDEAVRSLKG